MKQEYDLVIVSALGVERKHLQKLFFSQVRHSDFAFPFISGSCKTSPEYKICLIQCGVGGVNAARNLTAFLDQVDVKQILVAGLCGSLSPQFRIGDVFIPQKLVSTEKPTEISCGTFFNRKQTDHSEIILLSSSEPITTVASREQCHARTGAACVDMESYALAEIAQQRRINFSIIRAVSDDGQSELDPRLFDLLKKSGEPNIRKVLVNIMKSPRLLLALFAMYSRANIAMNSIIQHLEQNNLTS